MSQSEETLLKFPCDFLLKVFGYATAEFETTVLSIIKQHIPDLREDTFHFRPSKDNKYLSISATLHVTSKEQLDALYRELSSNPNVLMVL